MMSWPMLMLANDERWALFLIRNGNKILLYHVINIKNSHSKNVVLHLLIILSEYQLHRLLLVLPLQLFLIMPLSLHLLYNTSSPTQQDRRVQIQIRHQGVMIIHISIRIHIRNHHIQGVLRLLISSWMGDGEDLLLLLLLLVGVGVGVDLR